MDTSRIRRRFYPKYLGIGLVMIAGGMAILIAFHLVGVMPKIILIGGGFAVPVGVLVLFKARGRECVACSEELKTEAISISTNARKQLKSVLSGSNTREFVQLVEAHPAKGPLGGLEMKLSYCPKCKSIAVVKVPGWRPATFLGQEIARLVK